MSIVVFALAALFSLPKQFIIVYLGVVLEQTANGEFNVHSEDYFSLFLTIASGKKSSTQDVVLKYSIVGVTLVITVWAMWYIYAQMGKVKTQVIYKRRKARLWQFHHPKRKKHLLIVYPRQIWLGTGGDDMLSRSTIALIPSHTRPFNPDGTSGGQRWDERGNAIGWSDGPSLEAAKHAAQPTVGEGRGPLSYGGDSITRKHQDAFEHSTGPRVYGREVLVTPFDPRQDLGTRSLSGFHGDTN